MPFRHNMIMISLLFRHHNHPSLSIRLISHFSLFPKQAGVSPVSTQMNRTESGVRSGNLNQQLFLAILIHFYPAAASLSQSPCAPLTCGYRSLQFETARPSNPLCETFAPPSASFAFTTHIPPDHFWVFTFEFCLKNKCRSSCGKLSTPKFQQTFYPS